MTVEPVDPKLAASQSSSSKEAIAADTKAMGDVKVSSLSSVEDLRTIAPPLYKAIMESIAMELRRQQEAFQRRFKQALREGNRRG